MAYNPFSIFRRNQKALFAVLTVFIMIMFTLSFGKGDFFEQIPRWLGSRGGPSLCTIDGHRVTGREVQTVDFRRKMANRFMSLSAEQITTRLEAHVIEQQQNSKLGPEGRETAEDALQVFQMMNNPQFAGMVFQQLPLRAAALAQKIESPTAKPEDKELARAAQVMYTLLYKVAMGGRSHYFLNAPNRSDRDVIDFMLWEKKADQLGIHFTHADVARLIQNEFSGFYKSDVEIQTRKLMQQMQGFTMEAVLDALAAEFKVRAAQAAVLGTASRFHRAPAYPTPYETFEYYREQCSQTVYEAIPVPAAGFVSQVKGEPSDAEIKALFDKYQNEEPNPRSESPGFKEPRKIAVEWVGVTGEEPYYKKLAEQQIKAGEVMAKAGGMLTVPTPGALGAWAAAAAAPLSLKEPAVAAAYNTTVNQFKFQMRNEYSSSFLMARDILPSSVVKPGVLAATAGGFLGQTAGPGNPVAAVSIAMAAPIAYEIRDRVKVGLPLFLSLTPGPGMMPALVGGTAISAESEPKPLPADYLRPELLKTTIDARAKVIAFGGRPDFTNPTATPDKGDVGRFIEELGKMAAEKKDKAAIEKYVQEFITSRGLTMHGKSQGPRDEWHLEDDPGLQPLVKAQKESLQQAGGFHGNRYIPFGQSFFWTTAQPRSLEEMMNPRRGGPTSGNYQATLYPETTASAAPEGKPRFVVWRTEDLAPKKTNLVTARAAVVAAWKHAKARELAKAHADAMAAQVRAAQVTDPILLDQYLKEQAAQLQAGLADPKARQRAKPFTISGVAPMVPGNNPMMMMQGGGSQLQPYELKESENIPYPTAEMRKELLDNRDKPVKSVFVMTDAPKDTFYVTTLMHRDPKTPDDFKFNVFSRFGNAQMIRALYQDEAMKKSRDSVLELLKKEFKYEETEEQKKKFEENAKSGNRE